MRILIFVTASNRKKKRDKEETDVDGSLSAKKAKRELDERKESWDLDAGDERSLKVYTLTDGTEVVPLLEFGRLRSERTGCKLKTVIDYVTKIMKDHASALLQLAPSKWNEVQTVTYSSSHTFAKPL
jgi:hypothetical protein